MQSGVAAVGSQAEKPAGLSTALNREVEDVSILDLWSWPQLLRQ